jgi:hypothetical protein
MPGLAAARVPDASRRARLEAELARIVGALPEPRSDPRRTRDGPLRPAPGALLSRAETLGRRRLLRVHAGGGRVTGGEQRLPPGGDRARATPWGAEQVLGHSVAELAAACADLDAAFGLLVGRAAPLDQYYVPRRYPNSLPGGIP